MKTKFKRVSRRTLSMVLCLLMVFSTMIVGTFSVANAATTYYYRGSDNNWGATAMTESTDGYYCYIQSSNSANQFKIATSTSGWDYNYSYVTAGFNNTDVNNIGDYGSDNAYCWYSGGTYYILLYYPNTDINTTSKPIICASTTLPDDSTEVFYYIEGRFRVKDDSGNYVYTSSDSSSTYWSTSSTDIAFEATETEDLYMLETNCSLTELSEYLGDNKQYFHVASGTTSSVSTQYYPTSATTFNSSTTSCYLTGTSSSYNIYFSETSNSLVTLYFNASTLELYYETTAVDFDVTVSAGAGGTITAGDVTAGTTATVSVGSDAVTITASPDDGYYFTGWTSENGNVVFDSASSESTTITATGEDTVTANFKAYEAHTITYTSGGNGTISGSESATYLDVVSLTIKPDDGYLVDTVTLTANGTTEDITGQTSFTMPDANVTISATFKSVFDDTTLNTLEISDYTIDNTWVAPGVAANVTVVLKKNHTSKGNGATYFKGLVYYVDNTTGEWIMCGETETETEADYPSTKITFSDTVAFSSDIEDDYQIVAAVFGYDDDDNIVSYGYLLDEARVVTVSSDDPKVSLTARLSLTDSSGVTTAEGASTTVTTGETITLTGYCKNGNKAAGDYGENTADEYHYSFYYYTTDENSPTLINSEEIVDTDLNATSYGVTAAETTFTVSSTADVEYHFYVLITAYYNGTLISREDQTSKVKGIITATTVAPTVSTPSWAESYIYFHTIGDNITDSEAWTAMERYTSTKASTVAIGTYKSGEVHQVFLPASAENSDGTYLVYNNHSSEVTFTNGTTSVEIAQGAAGYIPSDTNALYFGASTTETTLNIYTSSAEENVYINTNGKAYTDSDNPTTSIVSNSAASVVTALGLDGSKSSKSDAIIYSPTMTLVEADGTINLSTTGKTIKGRGNTTWSNTLKKSYNINTNTNASVAGMAKGKKYSLLANFQDPSLSRNRFLYDLADSVGIPYAADSRYTDLYVNGLYVGSYLLTEKNDSIEDLDETVTVDSDGTTITDMDFMIELACSTQGDDCEFTPGNNSGIVSVALPDPEDFDSLALVYEDGTSAGTGITNDQAIAFVQEKYDALYNALTDSSTTEDELSALIDIESLAKVYLINELGKNYDSGVSSFYLTYKDGIFVASPVWDYDNSLGNNPTATVYSAVDDYGDPDGWWCRYWKGNSQNYDGNFMYNAANNDIVMAAASRAWFGTSADDKTSFIYYIDGFVNNTSSATSLGKDTGLMNSTYYYSVLADSATNNFMKWNIVTGTWVSGHDTLSPISVTSDFLSTGVDYDELSTTWTEAEALTTASAEEYDEYTIAGQYKYTVDWMSSRAAWLSYYLLDTPTTYYYRGTDNGWVTTAMTSSTDGYYAYYESSSSTNTFKISISDSTYDYNYTYVTNGFNDTDVTITEGSSNTNCYISDMSDTYYIIIYYPNTDINTTSKPIICASTTLPQATTYTAPVVTATTSSDTVAEGESATVTATITTASTLDGEEYTGSYVYELYDSEGTLVTTVITSERTADLTVDNSYFSDGTYTYDFYVVAYPEESSSAAGTSDTVTVNYKYTTAKKTVTYYVDMHDNSDLTPTLNFSDGDVTLSKVGTSTVYSGTYSTKYYKDTNGDAAELVSTLDSITADSKTFTLSEAPDVTCIDTGEAWVEATTDVSIATSGTSTATTTDNDTHRLYFTNAQSWSGTINAYAWYNTSTTCLGDWPGTAMTYCYTNSSSQDVYYIDVSTDAQYIVFTNKTTGSYQTADITIGDDVAWYATSTTDTDSKYVASAMSVLPAAISNYYDTLSLPAGDTANITPSSSRGTITYTSSDESVATVDSSGNVTGVAEGTANITVTSTGSSYSDTVSVTTAVTVTEAAVSEAYKVIAYNSATATFAANDYGKISSVTTTLTSSGYASSITDAGVITSSKGVYSVFYAVADDIALDITATSAASSDDYELSSWTQDGETTAYTSESITVNLPSAGTTTAYVAEYKSSVTYVNLEITYNFVDFDTSDGDYNYVSGKTNDASYTKTLSVPVDAASSTDTLTEYVVEYQPTIQSNYYDYTLDKSSIKASGEKTDDDGNTYYTKVTATMDATPHVYTVTVNGDAGGATCYFQEIVNLDASDYVSDDDVVWYNSDGNAVSTKSTYSFRVTQDTDLTVEAGTAELNLTSVITQSYTEIYYTEDTGTKMIIRNFYIENFYDESDDTTYLGSGVLYYLYNDKTGKNSPSALVDNETTRQTAAANIGTGASKQGTDEETYFSYSFRNQATEDGADYVDQTVRYSSALGCYNYIASIISTYSSKYANYSYRIYSYCAYKDSKGVHYQFSDTYATAKVYESGL